MQTAAEIETIEVRIPQRQSYGKQWAKVLTEVDRKAKDFRGFGGHFVNCGELVDLDPGAIVIHYFERRGYGGRALPTANLARAPLTEGGEWLDILGVDGEECAIQLREAAADALVSEAARRAAAEAVAQGNSRDARSEAVSRILSLMREHSISAQDLADAELVERAATNNTIAVDAEQE